MRFALLIMVLCCCTSAAASQQSQANDPPGREYFVQQCGFAALIAGDLAQSFPSDAEHRAKEFARISKNFIDQPDPYGPTKKQFDIAFIVMEALLKTSSSSDFDALSRRIIGEAAATCMAGSLKQ